MPETSIETQLYFIQSVHTISEAYCNVSFVLFTPAPPSKENGLEGHRMKLWKKLYYTIWLAFFSCVLLPRWIHSSIGYPVHILLGILLLLMTIMNSRQLNSIRVPGRLKRIGRVTMGFAIFQLVTGIALGGMRHLIPDFPVLPSIIHGIHIVCALAILAQASSLATAYDMWEEKEFLE